MEKDKLAEYLDLANHQGNATQDDIGDIVGKVLKYGFNSVFVNPYYVSFAKSLVGDKGKVGTVVSFPLGQDNLESKFFSAKQSARNGADELDVSLNVGLIKDGRQEESLNEMRKIVEAVKGENAARIVKFILETGYLTDDEIKKTSLMILESGADFIKTNSGMGPTGARLADIDLIRSVVGDKIKIKAAGGITTYDKALAFIKRGVDRIGTSHAVEIVNQAQVISLSKNSE